MLKLLRATLLLSLLASVVSLASEGRGAKARRELKDETRDHFSRKLKKYTSYNKLNEPPKGSIGVEEPSQLKDHIFQRQNQVVDDGVKRVKTASEDDLTMNAIAESNADPLLREKALAAMMGVKYFSDDDMEDGELVDLTAVRARRSLDRVEAMRGCTTLQCLRIAHERPPGRATFNFPHFLIAGWQKSGTTSLHFHIAHHPSATRPWEKEPEFFTSACNSNIPQGCSAEDVEDYIQRMLRVQHYAAYDGRLASYEASSHYARLGPVIAAPLAKEMPWLKIVLLMREPISRAASMLVHILDKDLTSYGMKGGCLGEKKALGMGYCLLNFSQLVSKSQPSNYSYPLKSWMDSFSHKNIFLGQYEKIIDPSSQASMLTEVKTFLGLDPAYPAGELAGFPVRNSRKESLHPDGWPMKKEEYQQLVDLVKPDCEETALLWEKLGYGEKAEWMSRWETVWDENLRHCDEKGKCLIKLS